MTSSRSRRNRHAAISVALLVVIFLNTPASADSTISSLEMPTSADAGRLIHVEVNIISETPIVDNTSVVLYYMNPGTGIESWVCMNLTGGTPSDGTWSYDIPAQPWEGELRCSVTETVSGARYPSSGYHVIEIVGEEAPKPFPWNIVMIVGFLAVALVFTELAFKPGVYRPTGRDRARKLEEEDRLREDEEKKQDGGND